jgi:hypothetical protein
MSPAVAEITDIGGGTVAEAVCSCEAAVLFVVPAIPSLPEGAAA